MSAGRRAGGAAALVVLPALFLIAELVMRHHAMPYWLWFNLDPSYIYLLNGMHILDGVPPGHIDHPGTPLQVMVAGVLWLSGAGVPGAVGDAAFRDAEMLLRRASDVLLVLDASAMIVVGWTLRVRLGSLVPALFAQTAPFLTMLALKHGIEVEPEPLLLFGVLLLSAGMAAEAAQPSRSSLLAMGVVIGFGAACKITFAPLGLAPLLLIAGARRRWHFVGIAALAFLVCIAPALGALPHMVDWFSHLAVNNGIYGKGAPTVIDPRRYPAEFVRLFFARPIFVVVYVLSAAALIVRRQERRRVRLPASAGERVLIGILAAQLAQMLLVAKHPSGHYVLPALELSGPAAAYLWLVSGEIERLGRHRVIVARSWLALLALIVVTQAVAVLRQDRELARESAGSRSVDMARDFPRCAHIFRDLASAPSLAWFDNVVYGSRRYIGRVAPLMPANDFFSLSWSRTGAELESWQGSVAPATLAAYPCIALRGTGLDALRALAKAFGARFDGAEICVAGSEYVLVAGASCPKR